MPRIIISARAHELIYNSRHRTLGGELVGGERLPNGKWSIPLQWDTIERLRSHKMEGESISDVIERLMTVDAGQLQ